MEKHTQKEDWRAIKKRFIEKYPALTDKDFEFEEEEKQLIHLVTRLGKSKEEIRNEIQRMKK